jgi:pimeloyl-ACP methyl ester carboxylesterase
MTFFARIVHDFIRQLNLQNVVLIGHSMGGQVAATFAVRYPHEVQKLVLIAPAGFETFTETDRVWIRSVYSPTLLKAMPADQIRRNFEINFSRFPDDAGFMIDDRMMMQGTKAYEQYCEMIPRCVNSMIDEPVFDLLPQIQAPTLVLFGENDMLIPNKLLHPGSNPVSIAEAGSRQIPGARLELLRPCGHFAQWECAGAVNRSIRRFCEGDSGVVSGKERALFRISGSRFPDPPKPWRTGLKRAGSELPTAHCLPISGSTGDNCIADFTLTSRR